MIRHEKQPTLPLIRVRVEYKDEEQTFNTIRFGQRFNSKVANPVDVVLLKREKKTASKRTKNSDKEERDELDELLENEYADNWEIKMDHYMHRYFDEVSRKKMQILTLRGMSEAVDRFINKSDKESLKVIIEYQMKRIKKHFDDIKVDVDKIEEEMENYRIQRMHTCHEREEKEEIQSLIGKKKFPPPKTEKISTNIEDSDTDLEDDNVTENQNVQTTQRGRGKGGRARGSTATTRATTSRARGRARGTRATTSTASIRQSSRTTTRTLTQTRLAYDDTDDDDD